MTPAPGTPESMRDAYWKLAAAAAELLKAWDAQQADADGDWGAVHRSVAELRRALHGGVVDIR